MVLDILVFSFLHLVAIGFACQALLTKRDPRSALGWTVTLVFLPVIGLALYLVFGIGRAQSKAERIMHKLAHIEDNMPIPAEININHLPPTDDEKTLANLAFKLSATPLTGGNTVLPLHNGNNAYPEMLNAINNARDHVFLSSYIFNYGKVGMEFVHALENAHKRGVDVRVIVDGIGALYSWRKPWRILKDHGVSTVRFRPPTLFPPNFGINLRSHRKVMICDQIGFTGGMNIADGDVLKPGKKLATEIQDIQFQITGPVVNQLRRAFLINWAFCTDQISILQPVSAPDDGTCFCRVIIDGPGNDGDALKDVICGAINFSKKSVRIMMPYFLPPPGLMESLRSAALRGVDVRIVLPAKNNLVYMNWAMERILPDLVKAGVRIWYQKPPFAHTKLVLVDDFYSLIGSANLDARSLLLNFELDMEIYDNQLHAKLADYINERIATGKELTEEYFKNLSLFKKLRNSLIWIFSPYL